MRCVAMLTCALIVVPTGRGVSQEPLSPVEVGQRVRVMTAGTTGWLTGTVVRLQDDTLVLSRPTGEASAAIPVSTLTRLQISEGRRSQVGKGAVIGGFSLAAVGAVVGFAVCSGSGDQNLNDKALTCGLLLGAGSGAGGAILGALVGAGVHSERWRAISLNLSLSTVQLGPRTWGLTFTMTL